MKLVIKNCLTCQKEFPKAGRNNKYCSLQCRWKSRSSYYKDWCIRNPLKPMLAGAKNRAKRDNLSFNIEESDLSIPERCPVLNIPLERSSNGKFQDNSPSLDRINNRKGYEKGNVRIISNRANFLKSDASLAELKLLVKDAHLLGY